MKHIAGCPACESTKPKPLDMWVIVTPDRKMIGGTITGMRAASIDALRRIYDEGTLLIKSRVEAWGAYRAQGYRVTRVTITQKS